RWKYATPDVERLAQHRLGRLELAELDAQHTEIVECGGELRMTRRQHGALDRDGTGIHRIGLCELTARSKHGAEIGHRERDGRVPPTVRTTEHIQRLAIQR